RRAGCAGTSHPAPPGSLGARRDRRRPGGGVPPDGADAGRRGRSAALSWHPTGKLRAYVVLVAAGAVLAFVSARPEAVLLRAPFAIGIIGGVALTSRLDHSVRRETDSRQALEGDDVTMTIEVHARSPVPFLDLRVELPSGCSVPDALVCTRTSLRAGEGRRIEVPVHCDRWGNHVLGELRVRARSTLGFFVGGDTIAADLPLTVYPSREE